MIRKLGINRNWIVLTVGGIAIIGIIVFGSKLKDVFVEKELHYTLNYELDDDLFPYEVSIPKSDDRQIVTLIGVHPKEFFSVDDTIVDNEEINRNSSYVVSAKEKYYEIDSKLRLDDAANENSIYAKASKFINSDDSKIEILGRHLIGDRSLLSLVLRNIFSHVQSRPKSESGVFNTSDLVDSELVSSKGKSQLFVALCRSLNLQSRVVGGIIVQPTKHIKRTHLWVEVKIEDEWVPFDVLHGHFAFIPANYLSIVRGDELLSDQLIPAFAHICKVKD